MPLSRRDLIKGVGAGALAHSLFAESRNVWGQDAAAPGGVKKYALHIGVNKVDTSKYGRISELTGCINDANTYQKITSLKDFNVKPLHNSDATKNNVLGHIYHAALNLRDGDLFVVTYAGHGGQLPDRNGDELSQGNGTHDETWCLFDQQLRDDLLYQAWAQFEPGVRILVVSDSCHSGTVARSRDVQLAALESATGGKSPAARNLYGVGRSVLSAERSRDGSIQLDPGADIRPRSLTADEARADYEGNTLADYDADERGLAAGDRLTIGGVRASGLLLAGCQDSQLSYESGQGSGAKGAFTTTFDGVLNSSPESYRDLMSLIQKKMPANQTPNFFPFGASDPEFYDETKPFTV